MYPRVVDFNSDQMSHPLNCLQDMHRIVKFKPDQSRDILNYIECDGGAAMFNPGRVNNILNDRAGTDRSVVIRTKEQTLFPFRFL